MNDHVTKPVAPERLMAVLTKWVHMPAQRAATSVPARPAEQLPSELLALTSLDTREGVRRIGGRVDAYRRQLTRFREHYADAATQLKQLATAQNLQQAQAYCHALRGVVGNIGALSLFGTVADIDATLKKGNQPDAAALDTLCAQLQAVMRDIDKLTIPSKQITESLAVALAPGQLRARLDHLQEALAYDLGRAEPLLAELQAGVFGMPVQSDVAAIAARVEVFDIDAAQTLLAQLHEKLSSQAQGGQS